MPRLTTLAGVGNARAAILDPRRRPIVHVVAVAVLSLVVVLCVFAGRANALAIGADTKPTGNVWDFHVWVIASDHDLIQVGAKEAITQACKARAGASGSLICGKIVDLLYKYVNLGGATNHGVWAAVYPARSFRLDGGRW